MGQRDTERGRVGRQAVRDGERDELAGNGETDHRHLGAVDDLLDEHGARAGRRPRRSDRIAELGRIEDEREPLLPLPVGRLDDVGRLELGLVVGDDLPPGLGNTGLVEPLALAQLVRRQNRSRRRDRVRQAELLSHARRDCDRPVRPRGDHAVQ